MNVPFFHPPTVVPYFVHEAHRRPTGKGMSGHLPEHWKAAWAEPMPPPTPPAPAAAHQLCGWTTDDNYAEITTWRVYEDHVVSAFDHDGGLQAAAQQHSAVENLASQMMDMQYSAATGAEGEEERPGSGSAPPPPVKLERSSSAPTLRSSIDTLLQGLSSVEDERVFMQRQTSSATKAIVRRERRAGGRAEPPRRALNLGVSRAHGGSIGKKPSGRRLDRNDPHGRARQADLAAARYSVTTWEDIQRFRVQAAATKARHEAWEAKPIAWDLVLAGSFSAMAAA